MKNINNYFQNLLKKEPNRDIFKIIVVMFFYLVTFSIFKAGLEYQNLISFKTRDSEEKINKVKYYIVLNGQENILEFESKKSLLSVIESVEGLNIDIISYYHGFKILKVNNSTNINLKINGNNLIDNLVSEKFSQLPSETKIELNY